MKTDQLLMNSTDTSSRIDLVIENLDEFAVIESAMQTVTLTNADYVISKSTLVAIG
jgi:hypothetical protein